MATVEGQQLGPPENDLHLAWRTLLNKQDAHRKAWAYYDGDHPLVYSTSRLKAVFQNIDARFSENWAAIVIDAELDRVNLSTLTISGNQAQTERLNELWESTELDLDEEEVTRATLVTGEAFVIAWKGEDEDIEAYYNDPRNVHAFYRDDKPREMRFAAKWWVDEAGKRRVTLYYPDRLEYYASTKKASELRGDGDWKNLQPDADLPQADNPYGQIPVFHFRAERRAAKSRLASVVEPQDAVNKLLNDMMVASEFSAFRQRYIISNADTKALQSGAGQNVFSLPGAAEGEQPTEVGEFEAANLSGFLAAIDHLANTISAITRTPKHYLFQQGAPSGEALLTMEAPLNKKATRFVKLQRVVWRKVGAFLHLLDGTKVAERDVDPVFDKPETVQPRTQAEIRQINVSAGIPLRTSLRWEGRSEEEIDQVETEIADEEARKQKSFAVYMLEAERQRDQGQGTNGRPGQPEAEGEPP